MELQMDVNLFINLINNVVKTQNPDLIVRTDAVVIDAIEKISKMIVDYKSVDNSYVNSTNRNSIDGTENKPWKYKKWK